MKLKLYNTLTRSKQLFRPIHKEFVSIYVCGATVNDIPHLGHARQQIVFDVLRKYLRFLGYNVKFVSNITDIDDKIINKASELNQDIKSFTEKNILSHQQDSEKINVEKPDIQPKATEYIKEMIELIKVLKQKEFAYIIPKYGVYYDTSKFKEYGKLSHQSMKDLMAGARIKSREKKRNKSDFVLWKFSKPGEPQWKSPWGEGRPGWHIECSAMSATILGLPFDIHGGGQDLIFPHHEDEIAQSEAGYGKKMANFWIHNGMVNIDNVKMSKSLGNFKTIRDLLKKFDSGTIRFFILSTHYRKPLDFSETALNDAKNSYIKLKNKVLELKDDSQENSFYLEKFQKAMNDDLNTAQALAVIWELIKDKNNKGKYLTIAKIDTVLTLNLFEKIEREIPKDVLLLANEREEARQKREWEKADKLRSLIQKKGFKIDDSPEGIKIYKI